MTLNTLSVCTSILLKHLLTYSEVCR